MVLMNSSIFNSKKLPKAFLTAFILIFLTIIGGAFCLHRANSLPAPMFSNRFSFDEKMRFMRMTNSYDTDFVVLGSSTGLNNFSSEILLHDPRIKNSYFNFSAWGFTTHSILKYWKLIKKIASPKVLILSLNLFEFQEYNEKLIFNEGDITGYLSGISPIWYYLKCHKSGLIDRIRKVGHRRRINNEFGSIRFDKGGGVLLEVPESYKMANVPWRDEVKPNGFVESAYVALDDLLIRAKKSGVIVVIVEGPLQVQYYDGDHEFAFLKRHWARVETAAKENDAFFLNMQGLDIPNKNLFADSIHLNREGANFFTKALLKRMDEKGIFQKVNDDIVYRD